MDKSTEYRHASMEWEEKIDAWLIEMEKLTTCDLFDPLCFKKIVYEHMATALYKDIDIILESARRFALVGVDCRQSFHVIRACEKLTIDWKYRMPFLKILELLMTVMMIYNTRPQDAMDIAVILAKNFKINSDSFHAEIHDLRSLLSIARLIGVPFEKAIKAAGDIRRKYVKIGEKMDADAVKLGIISKIKRAVVNRIQLIMDRCCE